jgi:hypothetical protein
MDEAAHQVSNSADSKGILIDMYLRKSSPIAIIIICCGRPPYPLTLLGLCHFSPRNFHQRFDRNSVSKCSEHFDLRQRLGRISSEILRPVLDGQTKTVKPARGKDFLSLTPIQSSPNLGNHRGIRKDTQS